MIKKYIRISYFKKKLYKLYDLKCNYSSHIVNEIIRLNYLDTVKLNRYKVILHQIKRLEKLIENE